MIKQIKQRLNEVSPLVNLIRPFERVNLTDRLVGTLLIFIVFVLLWSSSTKDLLPTPVEILSAYPKLFNERNLFDNFLKSISLACRSILYSSLIAIVVAYLYVIPLFKQLCEFLRKFRFLPSAGLSFLFMKMSNTIEDQMTWMMLFGVTTWLIDSMVAVSASVTDDEIMYAKSLKLSRWEMFVELIVLGRMHQFALAVSSNFAICWMLLASVENISKSSGGIGVILSESAKYYKFDQVYAIQLLILLTGLLIDYSIKRLIRFQFGHLLPSRKNH